MEVGEELSKVKFIPLNCQVWKLSLEITWILTKIEEYVFIWTTFNRTKGQTYYKFVALNF